jgi:hypothetical protein
LLERKKERGGEERETERGMDLWTDMKYEQAREDCEIYGLGRVVHELCRSLCAVSV